MKKVLLISMPFGALERQALGISLLKGRLNTLDIPCDIHYFTFNFAEFIGYDEYQWIAYELPYTAFSGDWAFTEALHGEDKERDHAFFQNILLDKWRQPETTIGRLRRVRSYVTHFMDYCMAAVDWKEYALVGFTSTFEQNIASLALAQRIKAAHPQISIVFGGANWEGEMGCELHRSFPFVDYACSGEADESFPALVQHIMANESPAQFAASIPGLIYREGEQTVYTGSAPLVTGLDEMPFPDFEDYFRDLANSTIGSMIVPMLLIETSRGCWWGAKSHCTFCGLNGGSMNFRSKSAGRALQEIEYLVDRWQIEFIEVVDNIIDMGYFKTLLPELVRANRGLRLFYEVKANLNRKHLDMLRQAGVYRIQAGIESMSNHVLKLMRKGTTAFTNLQILKWAAEYGLVADWNLLYNFPGETPQDYDEMLTLLRSVRFLNPPTGYGPIRLDRFSPYYDNSNAYGFTNIRPIAPYPYLYPFENERLQKIAYYFDYDYENSSDPDSYTAAVVDYVRDWQNNPERGALHALPRPDGTLALVDSRANAVYNEYSLDGPAKAVYEFCDTAHILNAVVKHVQASFPEYELGETTVRALLEWMVACNWMVTQDGYYFSLALNATPLPAPADEPAAFIPLAYLDGVPAPVA